MIKSYFYALITVLSLLIFIQDFYSRVLPDSGIGDSQQNESDFSLPTIRFLTDSHKGEILKQLNTYDVIVKPKPVAKKPVKKTQAPKVFIMSEDEQKQQQGQLSSLYDGNQQYKLVATFDDDGSQFALITQQDLLSGVSRQIRVNLGGSISAYKLTKIDSKSVQLNTQNRVVQLQLFTYKQT